MPSNKEDLEPKGPTSSFCGTIHARGVLCAKERKNFQNYRAAKELALTKNLPRGEIVLRVGALANGEAVMSVGFEYSGELTQPAGEVKVTLPGALLEGYTLTLLEADGAESELPFAVEGEELSFTLDFAPVEDEEPVPVRVIRLIPVAG